MRKKTESQIVEELASLAQSEGYACALAELYLLNFYSPLENGQLVSEKILETDTPDTITRQEFSWLIGYMIQKPINLTPPTSNKLIFYKAETERLLKEIHGIFAIPLTEIPKNVLQNTEENKSKDFFRNAKVLREAIHYGSDLACYFQYAHFALCRYNRDDRWLIEKKGFSVKDMIFVIFAIYYLIEAQVNIYAKNANQQEPAVSAFMFDIRRIQEKTNGEVSASKIKLIIDAFSPKQTSANLGFKSPTTDINESAFKPITPLNNNQYLLIPNYNLFEACFEAPFYWMQDDASYRDVAGRNRGLFTEEICFERLCLVFGNENVFKNVKIVSTNGKTNYAEIDVLVLFANRAIIIEAKSKKLTHLARTGNDEQLIKDFKMGVQKGCNQITSATKYFGDENANFVKENGEPLNYPDNLDAIYSMCLFSEHYPALHVQATHLLELESAEPLQVLPLISDIFFLDVFAEFCDSPLYFLAYLAWKSKFSSKIMLSPELASLGFYLSNSCLPLEFDCYMIESRCSAEITAAFTNRRMYEKGINDTPTGILTHFASTEVGMILESLKTCNNSDCISLGIELLGWNEKAVNKLSEHISKIKSSQTQQGYCTILRELGHGLTYHCNELPPYWREIMLENHCKKRKYESKSDLWFGISVNPKSDKPFEAIKVINHKWTHLETPPKLSI